MSAVGPPPGSAVVACAQEDAGDAQAPDAPRKSRRAKVLGAVGAVCLVGVIGAAIGVSTSGGGDVQPPSPPEDTTDPRITVGTLGGRAADTGMVGCYSDTEDREMEFRAVLDPGSMTATACVNSCRWAGYGFAGVQNGQECWCSQRNSGESLDLSRCDKPCSGDPTTTCGGERANQVYRAALSSLGCFVDGWRQLDGRRRRVLEHRVELDESNLTPAMCVGECAAAGFKYAGVQYGRECYCGDNHDRFGAAPLEECNWPCSGSPGEKCGAFLRNTVFATENTLREQGVGFARGVTGGGNAPEQRPSSLEELTKWLKDDKPRVIVLDREMNFIGTEGSSTEEGCRPSNHLACVGRGQDKLARAGHCENGEPRVQITYDRASDKPLHVGSHKTLRGDGTKGVIKGKGLRIRGRNVIVQNIHITQLNPHVIWGGDGINVWGDKEDGEEVSSDLVWLDHVKFSHLGRQMLTTGKGGSGRLTVSFCDFDGRTAFSNSCDGRHYWTALLYGKDSRVTFVGNHFHHTSGRAPKVGGSWDSNVVLHAANNVWTDTSGHDFDVRGGGTALIEGNYFDQSERPMIGDGKGKVFVPEGDKVWWCGDALFRGCWANLASRSGSIKGDDADSVFKALAESESRSLVNAVSAEETRDVLLGSRRRRLREGADEPLAHFGTSFALHDLPTSH